MTTIEQRRAWVLTKMVAGELTAAEAGDLLGLSERSVWRLKGRFITAGPAGLVHGNRGRASPRRIDETTREQVRALAQGRYDGANDSHLAELLAEAEGIALSRVSIRRILRAAGIASPRRRRPPRHRSRRDRMPQAGMLLQTDGSRHDWLEDRGPRLTLVGAIDDATGRMTAATFGDQEDVAGYLAVLRETVRRHGIPLAIYRDRHTFQDRLVTELRLAGAVDRNGAERVLAGFLPKFNRRFVVPPANPEPAWRPLPPGLRLDRICCLKYRRVVANDHTVRVGSTILQLPPGPGRRGYAGRRVELHLRLDGRLVVWDGERELLATPAPADPVQLRALTAARVEVGTAPPSAAHHETPTGRTSVASSPDQQQALPAPTDRITEQMT